MAPKLTTKEQLNLETAEVCWAEIQVFFAQGKLLVVGPTTDLVDTAALIADNHSTPFKKLIESKQIAFADQEWVQAKCEETTLLWAVVVAPYILVQLFDDRYINADNE